MEFGGRRVFLQGDRCKSPVSLKQKFAAATTIRTEAAASGRQYRDPMLGRGREQSTRRIARGPKCPRAGDGIDRLEEFGHLPVYDRGEDGGLLIRVGIGMRHTGRNPDDVTCNRVDFLRTVSGHPPNSQAAFEHTEDFGACMGMARYAAAGGDSDIEDAEPVTREAPPAHDGSGQGEDILRDKRVGHHVTFLSFLFKGALDRLSWAAVQRSKGGDRGSGVQPSGPHFAGNMAAERFLAGSGACLSGT